MLSPFTALSSPHLEFFYSFFLAAEEALCRKQLQDVSAEEVDEGTPGPQECRPQVLQRHPSRRAELLPVAGTACPRGTPLQQR